MAWEAAVIQEWLLELAMNLCNSTTISPAVDLFQQGFDRFELFVRPVNALTIS